MKNLKYTLKPEGDLFRIIAARDFANIHGIQVKEAQQGGLVSGPHNLSQESTSWIDENSFALENSRVTHNAILVNSVINKSVVVKQCAGFYYCIVDGHRQYNKGGLFKYIDKQGKISPLQTIPIEDEDDFFNYIQLKKLNPCPYVIEEIGVIKGFDPKILEIFYHIKTIPWEN